MQQGFTIDSLQKIDPQALFVVQNINRSYYIAKRALDFSLSLMAIILLSPLLAIVSILIKLDSSGPVIFKQDRISVKRRTYGNITYWQKVTFKCYKFRTMVCNADPSLHKSYIKALINNDSKSMAELQGKDTSVRKLTHDPRITRLGRILRKTSIDEIPQFINVIKGEMSLVGPRPAIPYEIEMYKSWHFRRLETKPGITGLWQVTSRSSCDFDEIVKLDIEYVDKQSFWMDLRIILKTPIAVLFCRGAV
jgi:lipopolysaccharide/colanic/teichoic acid biosynthesis glycosyltransferase